uniref:Putative secreted salivary gland peptide n=1 Tax=Ixodes ricinus TaxID=34613 RepID=A0A0K8R518_IXORI
MLLLRAILVVLSVAIESDSASPAKETEDTTLPPGALVDSPDSDNCSSPHLPYFDEETNTGIGFLAVSCTKKCPVGKNVTVVDGNKCIGSWSYLDESTITVLMGSCKDGICKTDGSSECRNITLAEEDSQEEEGAAEEKEDKEDEEGEEEEEAEEEDNS